MDYKKIHSEINKLLKRASKKAFGKDIPLISLDNKDELVRPSIKLGLADTKVTRENNKLRQKTFTFFAFYYAENDRLKGYDITLQIYSLQEEIENIFLSGIIVEDIYIYIDSINFTRELAEDMLITEIKFKIYEEITEEIDEEDEEIEIMEELEINNIK